MAVTSLRSLNVEEEDVMEAEQSAAVSCLEAEMCDVKLI